MTRHGQSGVTLIEMMIVLAVIGVATGAATLGLGALARDDATERAARRLAVVIGLAVDDALLSGGAQVLVWDARGYRVGTGARQELGVTLARGDGLADALVLQADAISPAVDFVLQGDAGVWHVAFDGLAATVAPGPVP